MIKGCIIALKKRKTLRPFKVSSLRYRREKKPDVLVTQLAESYLSQ